MDPNSSGDTAEFYIHTPSKKTVRTVEQPLKSLKKSPHFTTWRRAKWATFIFKVLTLLKMHKERKEQLLLMGKFQWDIFDDFAILWWYTTTSTTAHINSDPQLLQNITPQYSSSVFYRWTWPPPNEDLKRWKLKFESHETWKKLYSRQVHQAQMNIDWKTVTSLTVNCVLTVQNVKSKHSYVSNFSPEGSQCDTKL